MTLLIFKDDKADIMTESWSIGSIDPDGPITINYTWGTQSSSAGLNYESGIKSSDLNIRSKFVKGYIVQCFEQGKRVIDLSGDEFRQFATDFNKSPKANFPHPS